MKPKICIAPRCRRKNVDPNLFCSKHLLEAAARRGGWLSAFRRKQKLATPNPSSPASEVYDASNVAQRLWVGARPPVDRTYPGIDMIVLCAAEYQPEVMPHFHGQIVRAGIIDDALDANQIRRVIGSASVVAKALVAGKRVLVTCAAGKNRSALVAALALGNVTRMSAVELIALMRAKRHPDALYNAHFREYLGKFLPERKR